MGVFGLNQTFEYSELALDSWDATASGDTTHIGSSPNDKFSWPFFYFTTKQDNVAGIKLISATIPNVFLPVTEQNNKFTFTYSGVSYTIIIPINYYTETSLATQLSSLLNAAATGFSVSYSSTTLSYTITSSTSAAWSIFFKDRNTPAKSFGFLPGVLYSSSGVGSTITSGIAAQPLGPTYLYLNSQKLGPLINFNQADAGSFGGSGNPQVARIPINAPYGSTIQYTDPGKIMLTRSSEIF